MPFNQIQKTLADHLLMIGVGIRRCVHFSSFVRNVKKQIVSFILYDYPLELVGSILNVTDKSQNRRMDDVVFRFGEFLIRKFLFQLQAERRFSGCTGLRKVWLRLFLQIKCKRIGLCCIILGVSCAVRSYKFISMAIKHIYVSG